MRFQIELFLISTCFECGSNLAQILVVQFRIQIKPQFLRLLLKPNSAVSYHMFAVWIQFCSNFGCAIRIGITNTLVRLLLKSNSGCSYHMVALWIQFSSDFGCAISFSDETPISKVAVGIQFCCFLSYVFQCGSNFVQILVVQFV